MKRSILALAALCIAATAFSQKNSLLLYGRLGVNTVKSEDSAGNKNAQTNVVLAPAIGYWLTDHVAVGLLLGLSLQKSKISYIPGSAFTSSYTMYEIGAFVRYKQPVSEMFFLQADLYGVYGAGKSTVNDTLKQKGQRALTVALMPALGIKINPSSAVSLAMGSVYYSARNNPLTKYKESGLHMDFGQLLSIGFQTNIPLKASKIKVPD